MTSLRAKPQRPAGDVIPFPKQIKDRLAVDVLGEAAFEIVVAIAGEWDDRAETLQAFMLRRFSNARAKDAIIALQFVATGEVPSEGENR
jgi:hypothetical protein